MKIESPPAFDIMSALREYDVASEVSSGKYQSFFIKVNDRYLYWDEVKHRNDLPFDPVKSWMLIKYQRSLGYSGLCFGDVHFTYLLTQTVQKNIHEFDLKLIGGLYQNPISLDDKKKYLSSSLLEEAIASSQIEGAATTTKIAREMLKSERSPRNESEQMIFNNLRGIQFIEEELESELDFRLIIELHRIMTAKTSAEDCAGTYRTEMIYVQDHIDGEIAHTPPTAEKASSMMEELCDFVNSDKYFIHPIVKASIIHFMIGYIHPFKDGNGRTARALFYWYLLKSGYGLLKNISISRAILESRTQYDKSFLKTEHDGNDLTYFINYSIKSLLVAFESLIRYRDRKKKEREEQESLAKKLINRGLSKRQAKLLSLLVLKPKVDINISTYAEQLGIVRQTARKDLNHLKKLELIEDEKDGRNVWLRITSIERVYEFLEVA